MDLNIPVKALPRKVYEYGGDAHCEMVLTVTEDGCEPFTVTEPDLTITIPASKKRSEMDHDDDESPEWDDEPGEIEMGMGMGMGLGLEGISENGFLPSLSNANITPTDVGAGGGTSGGAGVGGDSANNDGHDDSLEHMGSSVEYVKAHLVLVTTNDSAYMSKAVGPATWDEERRKWDDYPLKLRLTQPINKLNERVHGEEAPPALMGTVGASLNLDKEMIIEAAEAAMLEVAFVYAHGQRVFVPDTDNAKEWCAAEVDALNDDGSYLVRMDNSNRTLPFDLRANNHRPAADYAYEAGARLSVFLDVIVQQVNAGRPSEDHLEAWCDVHVEKPIKGNKHLVQIEAVTDRKLTYAIDLNAFNHSVRLLDYAKYEAARANFLVEIQETALGENLEFQSHDFPALTPDDSVTLALFKMTFTVAPNVSIADFTLPGPPFFSGGRHHRQAAGPARAAGDAHRRIWQDKGGHRAGLRLAAPPAT